MNAGYLVRMKNSSVIHWNSCSRAPLNSVRWEWGNANPRQIERFPWNRICTRCELAIRNWIQDVSS